jgi:four helix bundle protein
MAEEEFGYEKLEVWQLGMLLTDKVYEATRGFPKEEIFGLTSQLRRSATSVPSNIAEGYGRGSKLAFANACKIARGELYEMRTQIEIAHRQKLIDSTTNDDLRRHLIMLSRKLDSFIRSLEMKSRTPQTANRQPPTANS